MATWNRAIVVSTLCRMPFDSVVRENATNLGTLTKSNRLDPFFVVWRLGDRVESQNHSQIGRLLGRSRFHRTAASNFAGANIRLCGLGSKAAASGVLRRYRAFMASSVSSLQTRSKERFRAFSAAINSQQCSSE
jgi:hypothetical protein